MNLKLVVSDIYKSYDGKFVLNGCSFSFVITTHDMSQAERLGGVMLIMSEGKIIQG
ncbi:hypothetical protein [Dissulfurispira sp.]|uniref:hypothetical protein n=1 Tax=Dissulfurispira sp. TaxID=2817609 RepID=UPI002FD93AA1